MMAELQYLVVENAPDVCEGIIRRMAPHTKWKPLGYALGVKEAITKIELGKPHLLFLDWGLNGGSAFEVMQTVQNIPEYNPYIIFNTGFQKDNPEIPQELINNYKVDKYLVKPIWENLQKHLTLYLSEAEEKALANAEKPKQVWLEDSNGKKIMVALDNLICICQHTSEPRKRIFYFSHEPKELVASIQWQKCYELLQANAIDFFITKNRGHLVCRPYITSFEKPYVRLRGFPAKVEVVKENVKIFEQWLIAEK
jgi:two-component system, LytTR family, response regulator